MCSFGLGIHHTSCNWMAKLFWLTLCWADLLRLFLCTTSFAGSDVYSPDDFPRHRFLFITHDHWDHLDYPTVFKTQIKSKASCHEPRCSAVILRHWGFAPEIISETDWDAFTDFDGFLFTPNLHDIFFSGRGLLQWNQSLWSSFVLKNTIAENLYRGDSGYDSHFKTIGDEHGRLIWCCWNVVSTTKTGATSTWCPKRQYRLPSI